MRIAYFPNQCALNSIPVMSAILTSLRIAGHTCVENSMDCDAVVIWSVLWNGRMRPNKEVYEHYRNCGKPVIVADVGTLIRGKTWKIAINHINRLGYYGHTENLDMDRPAKLGIKLQVNKNKSSAILIAAQHRLSLQMDNLNQEDWIIKQAESLRQVTDRPIVIRPHPRSPLQMASLSGNIVIETPQPISNTYDSFNIHFDYHAVVNYSSGPGIQSAIAGTRPIVGHYSLALPVSVAIDKVDNTYDIDRTQWLIEICHTEYTLNEIEQGLWLTRIQSHL